MPEIDTAETSDGTVPPLAAACAARSRHLSLSFALVMFNASFVALPTSLLNPEVYLMRSAFAALRAFARLLRPDGWEG